MDEQNTNYGAGTQSKVTTQMVSPKSRAGAAVLAFFLGVFGAHRLYVGKIGSGVTFLILSIVGIFLAGFVVGFIILGVLELIAIIDFFRIIFGGFRDGNGRVV